MIGTPLTEVLIDKGYEVVHMSRNVLANAPVQTYKWDLDQGTMDPKALDGVDYIIHLAGAGIADKPWTDERKQVIIDSRVKTAELLLRTVKEKKMRLKGFISASAIGWYPLEISDSTYTEDAPPADGFLGNVCKVWEGAADNFNDVADRVVKLRIGLVLAKDKGALKQIAMPVRYYVAAALGSGQQAMSWIHITDVCRMFKHSIQADLNGVYNAVGPDTITNEDFMQILADVMEKPLILPNVPSFIVRALFGGKAELILHGVKLSSSKILSTGFDFHYPTLNSALMQIYTN